MPGTRSTLYGFLPQGANLDDRWGAKLEYRNQLAQDGKYEEALATLRKAAQADTYDPDPHYLAGLCLLDLKRYAEAVKSYETTEALAPGWFHCREDLWLARQLAAATVDRETFLLLRRLEDDNQLGAAEKVRLAEEGLVQSPGLAPLYLCYGQNLQTIGLSQEARAAYLKGLRYCEEPAVRSRLLLNLSMLEAAAWEKRAWLQEAVALKGNLVSAAQAFIMLRHTPITGQLELRTVRQDFAIRLSSGASSREEPAHHHPHWPVRFS
jgi:tetratricopeptide (TPR) repeat protein